MMDVQTTSDINLVARFLAHDQLPDISSPACPAIDCIVICVSAVLHGAESVFRTLQARPGLTRTLVLCGGIGHSTSLLYEVVARSTKYHSLAKEIIGLPEARVLEKILHRYFDVSAITSAGCRILIEDKSTNCAANAFETRKVLRDSGLAVPKTCVVVQDPTMALRTWVSFKKAYEDLLIPPTFLSCPVFIPEMSVSSDGQLQYAVADVPAAGLWETGRFFDLIMGEIPRLRDDERGYGPKGKGFIPHVDIPVEVEEAWGRLTGVLDHNR
jgi:uncharacterized SAM-binding protein YcdF (DUF218 family)